MCQAVRVLPVLWVKREVSVLRACRALPDLQDHKGLKVLWVLREFKDLQVP